ncbi:DUF7507 domain-containing protein [Sulfitobacter sp. JB4-11]|uniref:DUF7507 domain-containing protein n=1 Tax=Sulfitobacter rhodophyticola TaxID=3238304 RepID=UPI003D818202
MSVQVYRNSVRIVLCFLVSLLLFITSQAAFATPNTRVSPDGTALPSVYPEAGGVAMILYGVNGNIYYQFSEPRGAFTGFQNTGQPPAFRGNPFTINTPLTLDCGLQSCPAYFGNQIVKMEVRFTALDGDTHPAGFDFNDISLLINGVNIGNWSTVPTENTNRSGTQLISSQIGFGQNTFDTGWFSSTNAALLQDILTTETIRTQVLDDDPNDNRWNFRLGNGLSNPGLARVAPAYTLEKRARSGSFSGPDITSFSAVGETIFYTYDIRNVGSVRIDNLRVTDDRLGNVACTPTSLNVGQTATCQASHQVTQEEFDAQVITNIATAEGDPEFGQLGTLSDTVTLTGPGRNPGITLEKTPENTTVTAAGNTINYRFVARNTGDVTLSNVVVTDPRIPGLSCSQASLAPNGVLDCQSSYTVTQADMDAGSIVNTATVTSTDPTNTTRSATDTATNTAQQSAAFSVQKATSSTPSAAGDTLDYTFAVRNDGNVSIRSLAPVDAKCAGPITLQSGDSDGDTELDPNETHRFTCTSVAVTQAEVDAGQVDNDVNVTGTTASGPAPPPATSGISTPITRNSGFTLSKSTADTPAAAGQTLTYRFNVGNSGNATITGVAVADAKCAAAPTLQSGDANSDSALDPSETWVFECTSIAVTQAEIDAGTVDNTATVTGTGADGNAVDPVADTFVTPVTQAPAFSVIKSTSSTPARAGETLNYSFALSNDGNVTISGITFTDAKCATAISLTAGDPNGNGALDVGETHTYVCTSVPVTQAEVDAGQVDNSVSVSGTPSGGTLTPTTGATSTPIAAAPALTLDKRLNAASPTSYDSTSDVLLYDFVVTNTGNVSLTTAITINDPLLDGPASCPALPGGGLAPSASIICTGQYSVGQEDINTGSFANTATASSGPTTSPSDTVTVPAAQRQEISMIKTAVEPASFAPGQTVTYTYTITNDGNTTIPATATMAVMDNRNPVSCPAIPAAGIAPTGTLACMGSYVIQPGDINLGTVTNTATANDGTSTSPPASATVPATVAPALTLTKTADPLPGGFMEAGDQITYSFTVQNTGGASLDQPITITDDKINGGTPFACWSPTGGDPTFDPDPDYDGTPANSNGQTFTCPQPYTVTQADIDAGEVINFAVANTVFAPGGANIPVSSPQVSETVTLNLPPALSVTKAVSPADLGNPAPGDTITYTFTLTNTGEVTLDDVTAVDTGPTFGGVAATGALSAFTVTSGPDGNTDGRVDTLAPDGVATVTATYTLSQIDIDNAATAGDPATAVANTASATATPRSGTLGPVTGDTATVSFMPSPAFTARKETSSTPTAAGDTLDYRFFVENTGNVAISGLGVTDAKCASAPTLQAGDLDNDNSLDVGETWRFICTSVAVTQAEIDAGQIDNTATVSGTPVGGTLTDVTASSSTPVAASGSLTVAKSTTSTPTAAGQSLDYTFVLSNGGNVSITPGTLSDAKCAAAPVLTGGDANSDGAVNPTENWTYTCTSIAVTQAEINAGNVRNTVTVPGTTPGGDPITPATDTVNTPVTAAAAFSVTKATTSLPAAAGDRLDYAFTVENDGNVSLSNLIANDAKCGSSAALQSGDANSNGALEPSETWVFACTSIPVTQAELDAGSVNNSVSISANDPSGAPVSPATDTLSTAIDSMPMWTLGKTTASTPTAAGDTLNYVFALSNTGNVSISAVSVTDPKCAAAPALVASTDAGADGILAPNESWQYQCTSIPVTQSEIDAGEVTNSASASGTPTSGTLANAPASNTTAVNANPALALSKASASAPAAAGDTLDYDFTVTNSGNTSLQNVAVTDAKCAAPATLSSGDTNSDNALNPTETWIYRCTSIPVTQAEVDAGAVLNSASVDAQGPGGQTAPTATATNRTPLAAAAAFSVEKTTTATPQQVGDTLDYRFSLSNDGNVSISSIVVSDAKCAAAPALQSGDANSDSALNPTENWIYTCTSIPVTQAEIDAGQVDNAVSVSGNTPGGDPVTPATDSTTVGVAPAPGIEAIKTITSSTSAVGETVIFQIAAQNTGNVTLSGVNIADTLTRNDGTVLALTNAVGLVSADQGSAAGTLRSGETATYRASYVLTQDDVDAGGITNTATVTGTPPVGAPVDDVSDDGVPGNGDDNPTRLIIDAAPGLSVVKSLVAVVKADSSIAASFDTVGDRLDYSFDVTNTGNVTIIDAVTITDPLITDAGGTITCGAVPLAPGASLTCTGSYSVVQADLNNGQVDNSATATDGTTTSDPSAITTPAIQSPALETTKTARTLAPADFVVGATATYDFVVTNSGNVTITDAISVSDNLIAPADLTCDAWPGTLDPGQTYACVGTYLVTSTDVDLGVVTNLASASDGTTSSPQTSESVPFTATPALSIAKSSPDTSFAMVDDVLTYAFEVTNSGQRAFVQPVTVTDDQIGTLTCFTPTATDPDFQAGEVATCSAPYRVTQADIDAGFVTNEAFAQTTFGGGTTVVSDPVTLRIDAAANPAVTLNKSAALPGGRTTETLIAGDVLRYTLSVENAGNQTLRNLTVSDPRLSLTCMVAQLDVAATDATCQADYTLTQADIDAGSVINDAAVSGSDPTGGIVDDTVQLVTPMPAPRTGISLVKTASPAPFGAVGSTIVYAFAVENTGNVTLRDVEVTDPRVPGYSCAIAQILPQQTNSDCSTPYTVTQADVDISSITNTATATGLDPASNAVTGTGQVTTAGPAAAGSLEATKTGMNSGTTAGSVVTYSVTIENTGNVTLDNVTPTDTLTRANGDVLALDLPGLSFAGGDSDSDNALDVDETWTFTGAYTLVQDDVNAGGISNVVDVAATDPSGAPVTDRADNGDDGDGNTNDDPTVLSITPGPEIEATKVVSTPGTVTGDVVVFDITLRNLGNVDLANFAITDQLTRLDGTALTPTTGATFVSGDANSDDRLNLSESWLYRVTYTLTQDDVDAGGIRNVATVDATDIFNVPVRDVADNGDDTDGNLTDDPTEMLIAPAPGLELRKSVVTAATDVGEIVSYLIEVENTGNVSLGSYSVADTLTRNDGTVLSLTSGPDFDGASAGSDASRLLPDGIARFVATYLVAQEDLDAGGVTNTALGNASTPGGAILTDASDDPNAPGTGPSDPTVLTLEQRPSFTAAKTLADTRALFPRVFEVSFDIEIENDGNTTLSDIGVTDDLAAFAAPATILSVDFPTTVSAIGLTTGAANAGFDGVSDQQLLASGATLAPGSTATIRVVTTYDASVGFPAPGQNTAQVVTAELPNPEAASVTAAPVDGDGDGVPDGTESNTADRDGDGTPDAQDYDPTGYFYCEEDGRILSGGQITVSGNGFTQTGVGVSGPITILRDGSSGEYQFFVSRAGTYALSYAQPPASTPSTTITATNAPVDVTNLVDVLTGTTVTNPRILGSSEFGATGTLADFSAAANPAFYTAFVIEAGDPAVFSNNIPFRACAVTGDLVATKAVIGRSDVRLGDLVTYQLTYDLAGAAPPLRNATFTDILPVGMSFVPGSATIARAGGAAVVLAPTQAGLRLSWPNEDMAPGTRTVIAFSARVGPNAPTGELINRTFALSSSGTQISNTATATVRRVPEHVFDCSDVIGKVFDDRNRDGYQDGPSRGITDQTYAGGKGKAAKAAGPQDEPGLPGVRVATVNGTLITTDAFGRFHVPCAELPAKEGSNFILKVDERSLPSGYRLTTENPRVVRLTAGKFAKMNFGAALGRVIDINLSGKAFAQGAEPSAKLRDAVKNLADVLRKEPSVVRLAYVAGGADEVKLGRARMRAIEKLLRQEWRGSGTYKLTIEKTIVRRR